MSTQTVPETQMIRTEVTAGVATITLTNPGRRNAITARMVEEIVATLEALEADESVRVLVLTGQGSAFCAGAELSHLVLAAGGDAEAEVAVRDIYRAFTRIRESTLPTIAAVNGPAVGAGLNMALVCDLRIAGRSALFSSTFLSLGLHPGGGNTWMLQRAVGPMVASAMTLFGEQLDGAQAERVGLVLRVVEDDDLLAEATRLAERAASYPREVTVDAKQSLGEMAQVEDYAGAVDVELGRQLRSATTPEFSRRMEALMARSQTS